MYQTKTRPVLLGNFVGVKFGTNIFEKNKSVHFARLEQVRLGLFYFFVMLLTLFIIGGFWDEIDWKDLFFILLATVIIVGVIYLGRSCTENLTAGSDCVG